MRGEHIVACTAAEIAEKVSVIEGHEKEQPSSVAQRCARIYAECNPKPGLFCSRILESVVRKVYSAIHWIVMFSNFLNMFSNC